MSESDLEDLLNQARAKNALLGITGTLVYESGHFLQVLEGEKITVRKLFDTIAADERHESVRILIEDTLDARQFAEWSMAWSKVDDETLLETFKQISKTAGASALINSDLARIRRFVTVLHGFL